MTRVALTQSLGRLEMLEASLLRHGLEVLRIPLVCTVTMPVNLEPLDGCPWWLISSVASVEALLALKADFAAHRFGAVGRATASAIRAAGGLVELIAPEGNAVSLATQFLRLEVAQDTQRGHDGETVGLPLGDRALSTIQDQLTRAGVQTRALCVYSSQINPWPADAPQPDVIVLASPTATLGLPESVAARASLIALGPTTAASVQARGWTCRVARRPSVEALLELIVSS
jgi:uroporphyrinogen-III synthase